MSAPCHPNQRPGWKAAVPWSAILLTIIILAGTIYTMNAYLRRVMQDQIVRQESESLRAATLLQQYAAENSEGIGSLIEEPLDQLSIILETSKIKGSLGVRLFDPDGAFLIAMPTNVAAAEISTADAARLRQLEPIAHFLPQGGLAKTFQNTRDADAPLLEVLVPLHAKGKNKLAGIAQYILDGEPVARQFRTLDLFLVRHSLLFFGIGTLVIAAGLTWSFQRLNRARRLLEQRTDALLHANHELSMAAKTSALGAVAAHLIHGLKNPLFGLHNFVANQAAAQPGDWQDAIDSTRRMQSMIAEIVRILQEENEIARYEISLEELIGLLASRLNPMAREAGVELQLDCAASANLSNRDANLVVLILSNLLQNGIQAAAPGKRIHLQAEPAEGEVIFRVRDEGPGLSNEIQRNLFTPCRSSKANGTGLGLAISKQLANHLGARLELESTSGKGTIFVLSLPTEILVNNTAQTAG